MVNAYFVSLFNVFLSHIGSQSWCWQWWPCHIEQTFRRWTKFWCQKKNKQQSQSRSPKLRRSGPYESMYLVIWPHIHFEFPVFQSITIKVMMFSIEVYYQFRVSLNRVFPPNILINQGYDVFTPNPYFNLN